MSPDSGCILIAMVIVFALILNEHFNEIKNEVPDDDDNF